MARYPYAIKVSKFPGGPVLHHTFMIAPGYEYDRGQLFSIANGEVALPPIKWPNEVRSTVMLCVEPD